MDVNDETGVYGMGQGCPTHGDEHMKECSMCGAEFCRICFPKSSVCPDCADTEDEEDDEDAEADPDFDDVKKLDDVLDDDLEEEEEEEDADRRY